MTPPPATPDPYAEGRAAFAHGLKRVVSNPYPLHGWGCPKNRAWADFDFGWLAAQADADAHQFQLFKTDHQT